MRRMCAYAAVLAVALMGLCAVARAEICTVDDVPAATLLLPYFEVDWTDPNSIQTLFSINNASATAVIGHVTLWTDESIPTLDFDVYLTGYDVVTINLRDLFNGILPVTASDGQDPKDTISPQGPASQDINFASCQNVLPFTNPAIDATRLAHIRNAHTGKPSTVFGGRCSGFDFGDNIARGYITVDTVNACNLLFPSSAGYFTGTATFQNVLWGDYFIDDGHQNFASGETLVHIEACTPGDGYSGYVGNGAGNCPFTAGDYTFYGRYVNATAADQREPLATTFASRFVTGGAFNGGTDLLVWRDSKTTPTGANGTFTCGSARGPAWFPLSQQQVIAFDEQEHLQEICIPGSDNVSPPIGEAQTCFPLEAQRINVSSSATTNPGDNPSVPYPFGWLFLNLNTDTSAVGGLFGPTAQAWIETEMRANGRFEVGFDAIKLDSVCATEGGSGGVIGTSIDRR